MPKAPKINLDNYQDAVDEIARLCDLLIGAAKARDQLVMKQTFELLSQLTYLVFARARIDRKVVNKNNKKDMN